MLFQAYYSLDPWFFDPPVASFPSLRFDLNTKKFSLYVEHIRAGEDDRDAELQLRALYLCDDMPADVAAIFACGDDMSLDPLLKPGDGLSEFPASYREFVSCVHQILERTASTLFNMVRWRFGIYGGPLSLASHWAAMRWHCGPPTESPFDEHGFLNRQIPAGVFAFNLPKLQIVSLNRTSTEIVEKMFSTGAEQPLYHDLFREAWQSKENNPRSSLVMAMAAAETALKTTAVDLYKNAGTTWLFENLPSPPIDRMLRDYIQLLPARKKDL